MKRKIVALVLLIAIATLLSAAANRPIERLDGILHWKPSIICGVPDYVSLPVMDKVYLTGNFKPTHGVAEGCTIHAFGSPYMIEGCRLFAVARYTIDCGGLK